jgi:hypothetical protein
MRAAIFLIAILIGFAPPACAADDVAAGQTIIRAQEQAIARDDAANAYSYAAPVLQTIFGQPDIFMQMVRKNYAPVYRHKKFEFGEGRASDGNIAQIVYITDADGDEWEALYTLEKQPDGNLKITGCSLKKSTSA